MSLDMVLNELSLQTPAPNVLVARQWMSDFIQTIRAVKAQAGKQAVLRTQYNFHVALLADGYPIGRWLNDGEVDREEQRFIKTLVTKSPFSQDILNIEIQELENRIGSYEFLYQGEVAIGLGVACILDIIAISLRSKPCWDCSYLDLEIIRIDEEDEIIPIVHASCKEHLNAHFEWFKARSRKEIYDGATLWNKQDELFPNLQFCDSVKEQLYHLHNGNIMLKPIEKKLFELQEYATSWIAGPFDPSKLACKANPESEATLNQYSQERTFICPDGEKRLFDWHVKLTPLAWRIHFYPSQPGQIIIGYIGRHLRTARFK
ncbi:hypothetical protein [Pantanalinema sp. GBBB05]|uniref:hypothetical protein n=1 Tax=Pantanalinema sp. GBBB05 TaxID=2604139 RepID=UPI001D6CA2C9|nr:hypothetical protein [Pantanalinema sp. GBBB05]